MACMIVPPLIFFFKGATFRHFGRKGWIEGTERGARLGLDFYASPLLLLRSIEIWTSGIHQTVHRLLELEPN
jgi:hypothetical protein